jgi:hypothetical protein
MMNAPSWLFTLFSCLAVIGCSSLTPTEAQLIGSWEMQSMEGPLKTTIKSDHTFVTVGGIVDTPFYGRWRVEGNDLVMVLELPGTVDYPAMRNRQRESIASFVRLHRRIPRK